MYKARVEAVNGIKVRAGGKLLTCIGNRPVKIGDTIWTDGRCVYGNDEESQTPLIIPPKVEVIIPVQIEDYIFYFSKGKLKQVGQISSGTILNSKKNIYSLKADAANCYDNGIIYTINADNSRRNFNAPNYKEANMPLATLNVSIEKNGVPIKQVPLQDLIQNAINQVVESLPRVSDNPDGPAPLFGPNVSFMTATSLHVRTETIYSFIENEKNWASGSNRFKNSVYVFCRG